MKKEKKSFIIFQSWEDGFNMLNESERAQFITNLFLFHRGEDIILNSPMLELFWKSIQYNLKRNVDEYDLRSVTSSENGSKGGAPKGNTNAKKKHQNNLNQPNQPNEELGSTYSTKNNPNDNDNDNDNGNVNENGNDDENENVNGNVKDYNSNSLEASQLSVYTNLDRPTLFEIKNGLV